MNNKERPIIFSTPMVQAILDGRKTQTRRIVKPQPYLDDIHWRVNLPKTWLPTKTIGWPMHMKGGESILKQLCPYGTIGHELWVRETWGTRYAFPFTPSQLSPDTFIEYRADPEHGKVFRWIPSIHMPRKFSRIQLRITNVRVERLKDITTNDAYAEGILTHGTDWEDRAVNKFQKLWESINGKGSWDSNPWVWVIEFERIENENRP